MGERFDWVNVDKKEYLCPLDFDLGDGLHASMFKENDLLRALRELLATDWKGCRVLFLGDECEATDSIPTELYELLPRRTEEPGCVSYRNVSGLFKASEEWVRKGIEYYLDAWNRRDFSVSNDYGIDVQDPYSGLFLREGKTFRYTLNHTKKLGYSLTETKILFQNGTQSNSLDPLPLLLGCGRTADPGPWLGDIIGAADTLPPDYRLLPEITLDW